MRGGCDRRILRGRFGTIGYGHGVGMSQTGADAMAAQGARYEEILAWYYTGAELKRPTGVAV